MITCSHRRALVPAAGVVFLLACENQTEHPISGLTDPGSPSFMTNAWSGWAEPVRLDAPVNSACQDQTQTLSKDELSLYFTSTRRGGLGIDTPGGCQDSWDGRTLLFISPVGRGGLGFFDIWMTTRTQMLER